MGIGLIVFMGIFIKVCAVHTPSSNPNKPAPRKLMTLRPSQRHRNQVGGVTCHARFRLIGPFLMPSVGSVSAA